MIIGLFFVASGIGLFRVEVHFLMTDRTLEPLIGNTVVLEGVVIQEPDIRETSTRAVVRVLRGASSESVRGTVLVSIPPHTDIAYGEEVRIEGILNSPKEFDVGLGRTFNYPAFLAAQGVQYEIPHAQITRISETHYGNPVKAFAIGVKQFFIRGIEKALPEPYAGLAGGILAGNKRGLGEELTDDFKKTSLIHVVVLSGYNITIVISALLSLMSGVSRWVRLSIGIGVALFFALMTGGASASVRAALMAVVSLTGDFSGRVYRPERALLLIALCMVLWNPLLLAFDPGFQLSFLATLGLISLSPFFFQMTKSWVPSEFQVRDVLVSSLAAQAAVLPLLLYQTGQFSLVAIPANVLVLVAVPLAMFFAFIAGLGGLFLGILSPIFGLPALVLLAYIIFIAHWFAQLPFAALGIPAFSVWVLAFLYAIMAYGTYRFFEAHQSDARTELK
jgi:competence protein ComEC